MRVYKVEYKLKLTWEASFWDHVFPNILYCLQVFSQILAAVVVLQWSWLKRTYTFYGMTGARCKVTMIFEFVI